jgi:hypothetical protein
MAKRGQPQIPVCVAGLASMVIGLEIDEYSIHLLGRETVLTT